MQLLHDPVFLLLTIIVLGELIGSIRFLHFSLDSSAIIFVGLGFGAAGYTLPSDLQTLGLTFFLYSVGIQAGPGFISSFKTGGLRYSLGAILLVFVGFLTTLILSLVFRFDPATAAGLFSGALTSTPGLAVAAELSDGGRAGAAYGLTYTFGVVGVILFLRFLPFFSRVDLGQEEANEEEILRREKPPVTFFHIEVTNENLFGKRIHDLDLERMGSVNITRVLRKGSHTPELVSRDTILHRGDRLRIVGRSTDLDRVVLYIGRKTRAVMDFNSALEARRIVVSRAETMGESPASLNIHTVYNVHISRLTRNGIELPVSGDTRFAMGDTLTMVGRKEALDNVARLFGNDLEATYATRALPVLLGIFAGFLLGKIPLYFPFVGIFYPGTSGGILLAGLILGHLKKTGPIVWEIPVTANAFLRELGLFFFLSAVGTASGERILHVLENSGVSLLFSGILVTLIPPAVVFITGRRFFGIGFLRLLGVLTGGMTSTPGLAAAQSLSSTRYAAATYATVYPVALVGMIVFTRVLLSAISLIQSLPL